METTRGWKFDVFTSVGDFSGLIDKGGQRCNLELSGTKNVLTMKGKGKRKNTCGVDACEFMYT